MSFCHDRQIKRFCIFLLIYTLLLPGTGFLAAVCQVHTAEEMYLSHDCAIASSLLNQGISKKVIADALTNQITNAKGRELVSFLGFKGHRNFSAFVTGFWHSAWIAALSAGIFLIAVLWLGMAVFFLSRRKVYLEGEKVLKCYINGDYSRHLPQNKEGSIFRIFAFVEQLATMLRAKNEAQQKTKEFLKNTISDISHQLKTPLAALTLYQEIIENEPDNPGTVKEFTLKTKTALNRMERLIGAMLKITRLDAGSIVFDRKLCLAAEVAADGVRDLATRAESEGKEILLEGDPRQFLLCDPEWTSEAIGNIVKNALDHTDSGGVVRMVWESGPAAFRISISDNGRGIPEDDIHHIFKRFYRSRHLAEEERDTLGIGLGLPLAKAIVEGQEGNIFVQSSLGEGTVFILSFPYKTVR